MKPKKKLIIIVLSCIAAVCVCIAGIWAYFKVSDSNKEVTVIPVSNISGGWYGGENYSSGTVSSSKLQEVYLKDGESIKEVFVKEGDEVKAGDKLLEYDATVLKLDIEEKKISIQQSEAEIKSIKEEIAKWQNTSPTKTGTNGGNGKKYSIAFLTGDDSNAYDVIDESSKPYTGNGTEDDPYRFLCTKDVVITGSAMNGLMGYDVEGQSKISEPSFAVFEIRKDNIKEGMLLYLWTFDGREFSPVNKEAEYKLRFEITDMESDVKPEPEPEPEPEPDPEPEPVEEGYTAKEIANKIAELKMTLQNEELNYKENKLALNRLENKLDNCTVFAAVDGTVKSVADTEDGVSIMEPVLVVNGDKGVYVTGVISELMLDTMKTGDMVSIQSYDENGAMTYEAEVIEILEYPVTESNQYYYSGEGNTNVSYYPFTAVISDDCKLATGQYVDIMMNAGQASENEGEELIYISKAYIRQEKNGDKYVYIADENDRLVKSYIETGKVMYGDMTEIKSGLTIDDRIAFPYGRNVKEGIKVKEEEYFYK